jgi:RNA polymerase sigma factor for flagellar operon FliA
MAAGLLTLLAATAIILSKAEQSELCAEYQKTQNKGALHRLIESNVRLAHKVAKKNMRSGIDFEDLLAQAVEGIVTAAGKFDASKNASFTTYARMWMIAKCQEYVQANAGMVHCGSRTSKKLWSGLQKARRVLGPDAKAAELAAHMDLDVADVEKCLQYMSSRGTRLDAPINASGGTVASVIADKAIGQDEQLERRDNAKAILVALSDFTDSLSDNHKAILAGRVIYDILGKEKRDATSFGVTKQRVGQIEKQLRAKLADHFIRSFGAENVQDMIRF